jgi:hypothetical protein
MVFGKNKAREQAVAEGWERERERRGEAENPIPRAASEFEYHVMGAQHLDGVKTEIDKRAREGWDLVTAYQESGASQRHYLFFRRRRA